MPGHRARSHPLILIALILLAPTIPAMAGTTTWHVDAAGPNDPAWFDSSISDPLEDGSEDHPFDAIQEGIDASNHGDEIRVAPAPYEGLGNNHISFQGRAVRLWCDSPNPKFNKCMIEGQFQWGFTFDFGETNETIVEGFEIIGNIQGDPVSEIGIRIENASPTIRDCAIHGFTVAGIDIAGGSARIVDTEVADVGGSGIRVVNGHDVRIEESGVAYCGVDTVSGAITIIDGQVTLTDCEIHDGFATGVLITQGAIVTMIRSTIVNRSSELSGGAVRCLDGSSLGITHSAFLRNQSFEKGGAVYYEDSAVGIYDSLFAFNYASTGGGLAFAGDSNGVISRCTVAQNEADSGGNMAILNPAGIWAISSIFWNTKEFPRGGVFSDNFLLVTDCDVQSLQGQWLADGVVLNVDPKFLYPDDEFIPGFQLQSTSPCINKGQYGYVGEMGDLDLAGQPRVQDCRLDIGAYETNVMIDCNNNMMGDGCDIFDGIETDCNYNDIPDTCDLEAPPVVFQDDFEFYDVLDPQRWPVQVDVELNCCEALFLLEPGSLVETRSFNLAGAERATLAISIRETSYIGGDLNIDYWDGAQWNVLRQEVPEYTNNGDFTPASYVIDLPRNSMHFDARLRFRNAPWQPNNQVVWAIDDVVVTRYEGDCDRDGAIEPCAFAGKGSPPDCNHDRWPDECESGEVLLGHHHQYAVGPAPSAVTAGDFDNDGDVDLAVTRGRELQQGYVRLLIGDGQGAFTVAEDIPVGVFPRFIIPVDIENDGDLDLAVANGQSGVISILKNLGGLWWGFMPNASPDIGDYMESIGVADIDKDGDSDLVVAVGTPFGPPFSVTTLLNDGAGTFSVGDAVDVGNAPRSIALFDANLDGHLDAAVTIQYEPMGVQVLLNDGFDELGSWEGFGPPKLFLSGSGVYDLQPFHVVAGDFDRDGDDDLSVSNAYYDSKQDSTIGVILNEGIDAYGRWKGLRKPQLFNAGRSPRGQVAVDLDGDHWLDLAVVIAESQIMRLYRNRGDDDSGAWLGFETLKDTPVGIFPTGLAVIDVNRDGALDFVCANRAQGNQGESLGTPTVSVYLQTTPDTDCNGNGTPDGCDISTGASHDLNDDGLPDECQPDCNGNDLPDDIEFDGTFDTLDCNANRVPDECDIASTQSKDCNGNQVPDECEARHRFQAESGFLSHIGSFDPQRWVVPAPPTPASDVTLHVITEARLGPSPSDYHLDIQFNGQPLATMYGPASGFCPRIDRGQQAYQETLTIPIAVFRDVVAEGDATFDITSPQETYCFPAQVSTRYSQSYARLTLQYAVAGSADCNESAIPDSCDVLTGYSLDLNTNELPDECDGLGDSNASGDVDLDDLAGLAKCLQAPEAISESCKGYDFNLDGHVDLVDIRGFMMVFGRP